MKPMKRSTLLVILAAVALLCVTACMITLCVGGNTTAAIAFAKWAYGGIGMIVIVVFLFGGIFGAQD